MNSQLAAEVFLRRQRSRSRDTLLFWAVFAVLVSVAFDLAVRLKWIRVAPGWNLIPAAAGACLLLLWIKRVWNLDSAAVARASDARHRLSARLESAVELSGGKSALAVAQRTETAQRIQSLKPEGTAPWIAGIVLSFSALAVIGLEVWALRHPAAAAPVRAASAPAGLPAKATPAPLLASISWKAPAARIRAKAVDEIPLLAHAASNRGFSSMALQIWVNGAPTNSFPLTASALPKGGAPGEGDVAAPLYLDEVGVKPGDVVTYGLKGRTAGGFPAADVVSPRQTIEIVSAVSPPKISVQVRLPGQFPGQSQNLRNMAPMERLQKLALRQKDFLHAFAPTPARPAAAETAAPRQEAVAKDIASLVAENSLEPSVERLASASELAAAEAARQLALNDPQAARVPEAEAQSLLDRAASTQMAESLKSADAVLEQVRQELMAASNAKDPATRSALKAQALSELQAEAERQRQEGSADLAQTLSKLANQLASSASQKNAEAKPPASPASANSQPPAPKPSASEPRSPNTPNADSNPSAPRPPLFQGMTGQSKLTSDTSSILNDQTTVSKNRQSQAGTPANPSHSPSGDSPSAPPPVANPSTPPSGNPTLPSQAIPAAASPSPPSPPSPDNQSDHKPSAQGNPQGSTISQYTHYDVAAPIAGGIAGKGGDANKSPTAIAASGPSPSPGANGPGNPASSGTTKLQEAGPTHSASSQASSNQGESVEDASSDAADVAKAEASIAPTASLKRTQRQAASASDGFKANLSVSNVDPRRSVQMLISASQMVPYLKIDNASKAAAEAVIGRALNQFHHETLSPAEIEALAAAARQLANILQSAVPAAASRDEWMRRFNPEDVDPAYRKAVSEYYEQLSRTQNGP